MIDASAGEVRPHPEKSIEDRLRDLELAVFGDVRQRIPGLINLMPELADLVKGLRADVGDLKNNRQFILQMLAQGATFIAAAAALIVALNK